jgi:hypothetical protein
MRHLVRLSSLLALICLFSFVAQAQTAPVTGTELRSLGAARISAQSPIIDGNLSDSIWVALRESAQGKFTQRNPFEGQPATESTFVAVAYDDKALYVAFWCYDNTPDKIIRPLVRRDRLTQSDRVYVMLDPQHDHQTGSCFMLSAAGVLRDVRFYDDNQQDETWDAVWEGNARVQPWGWTAEFKIPYHCLRFPQLDSQSWGVNFTRYIGHKNEYVFWKFTPTSVGGAVSNFGHLTGLTGLHPASHVELLPYTVAKMETDTATVRNADGRKYSGNAGVDVKYSVTPDLVLDATINPDFGQVELDQPVLNLSEFETYFAEKRPFFVEGANLFSTDYTLFYSRRIGRPPQYDVTDPEGAFYTDYPNATTILGAAKLTGRIARRTTLAVLTALTSEEKAEYAALSNWTLDTVMTSQGPEPTWVARDTAYRKGVVEPFANYSVVRVKQDVLENSYIGATFTNVTQDQVRSATTGGFDWHLMTNNRNWLLTGQAVFTHDGGRDGNGIAFSFSRVASKHITGGIQCRQNSRYLNFDRLGFQWRPDFRQAYLWTEYRTNKDWWIVRTSTTHLETNTIWNLDGDNIQFTSGLNTQIEFRNAWLLRLTLGMQNDQYSDTETRGLGLWAWPVRPTFAEHVILTSDTRKPLYVGVAYHGGEDRGGTWWATSVETTVRPKSYLEFNLSASYERYKNAVRYLTYADTLDTSIPLFADLNQDVLSFSTSNSILFRRNLSLQLSADALITGLDYAGHRLWYPSSLSYSEPYPEAYAGLGDMGYTALNAMALLRWEYLPGSTLYVVWARTRDQVDGTVSKLDLSRDLNRLFSRGSKNVFLVKISYWLNA